MKFFALFIALVTFTQISIASTHNGSVIVLKELLQEYRYELEQSPDKASVAVATAHYAPRISVLVQDLNDDEILVVAEELIGKTHPAVIKDLKELRNVVDLSAMSKEQKAKLYGDVFDKAYQASGANWSGGVGTVGGILIGVVVLSVMLNLLTCGYLYWKWFNWDWSNGTGCAATAE